MQRFFKIKIINLYFFPNAKAYIGCYIGGYNYDLFTSGLNSAMISANPSFASYTSNNKKLLAKSSSMSIGKCVSLCLSNGFFLAGLVNEM